VEKLATNGYACAVAAKNKSKGRHRPVSDAPRSHEVQGAFDLQVKASQRRDELLAEARELKAAGRVREARRLTREAQTIQRWLTALEGEFRRTRRTN
jgi:hypothetical protein